ncbi:MAG TPA: HDOD domain-containing protein [Deltaproteobacteria bacterium]|nr:HDOD domain-containing protein [Deltaproteobacteria bacterium]
MLTAQTLVKKFGDLKTLPHVAIRLNRLISRGDTAMAEFERVIKTDPVLVLRLLRVVNSPYYGPLQKIDNISRAVVFMGMKNLRNMVVTMALRSVFEGSSVCDSETFSRRHLWLHCTAVSICSQMISERIFGSEGDDAYLCGILHDIGMIVEDQAAPDLFIKACEMHRTDAKSFTEYEKEIMGDDHCEVGHLLACEWNLPADVQNGILHHHNTQETISPTSAAGVIQLAEYMVSRLNYQALPGMEPALSKDIIAYLKDNIEEFKALAMDLPDEIAKGIEMYELQGDE